MFHVSKTKCFPYKFSLLFYTIFDEVSTYLLVSVDDCCYINYLLIYRHVHIKKPSLPVSLLLI